MPAQLPGDLGHVIRERGAAQGRHGIIPLSRRFKNVACRIELPLNVPGLAGDADFLFHDVVIRLQIVVGDGPILQRRPRRNRTRAISPDHFGSRFEVPRFEAPALRPVVNRRASDRVHHRMGPGGLCRLRRSGAKRGTLQLRFRHGSNHAANVVVNLIGVEVPMRVHPRARFDSRHSKARASQRQHRHAPGRAQPDHRNVDGLEVGRHLPPTRCSTSLLFSLQMYSNRSVSGSSLAFSLTVQGLVNAFGSSMVSCMSMCPKSVRW